MKFKFIKLLVGAVFMTLIAACAQGGAVEIGEKAPEFMLQDTNGNPVSLSESSGKVVILDFFASWCPPCRKEIPDFIELQKEYGDKGFTMIGVSLTALQDTKDFVSQSGINYPVLVDDGNVSNIYGPIRSIPTTFVIGKDGKVIKMYIGYRSKDIFEKDIKENI